MKKILLLLLLILSLSLFASCTEEGDDGEIDILCTVFPLYDWTQEILSGSDCVSLDLLVKNGTDMHSYQGSVQDIVKIAECDVFIYVGGESDAWVEDVLRNHENPDRTVLRLLDYVECADDTCHSALEHSHTHEGEGYDEHIWLSLRNAARLSLVIADAVAALDLPNAALYLQNAEAYVARLNALDLAYAEILSEAEGKLLLFADRFPFVYLTEEYGIECLAAFSGCSAESEASVATVRRLADAVNAYQLTAVLLLEGSTDAIASSVIATSGAKNVRILSVDSMQSIDADAIKKGASYLSIMEDNLDVFKECLQ